MDGKKAVFVRSRHAAEAAEPHTDPHIIISINCPGDEPARIRTNRTTLGRLNLFVWDIDKKVAGGICEYNGVTFPMESIPDEQLFQPEHAKQVCDFIEAHPDAEDFIVHCTAGKSRSAGCAGAISKIVLGTDESIFTNKRFTPNMRVYRMILDEWFDRHPMETQNGDGHPRDQSR